jgi:acetyl-CoA carboxylase beta subunit
MSGTADLLSRNSFVELDARARVRALVDAGSFRELIDPFERMTSPWLARQGVVTQTDDGVVVAKGTIGGQPAVVLAIEGAFQGGSLGEVGGAKIAGALELAAADNRQGVPTRAVILFETGGVRLQEAGITEYDSRDRPFIWSFTGGEQRHRTGLVDAYVDDDAQALRDSVIALIERGRPMVERSDAYQHYLDRLAAYDASVQATPQIVRQVYAQGAQP